MESRGINLGPTRQMVACAAPPKSNATEFSPAMIARDGKQMRFFHRSRSRETVHYVRLGRAGLKISNLCLGTMSFGTTDWQRWTIDERRSRNIVRTALDTGINFFDTADVYSNGASEEILGRALRELQRPRRRRGCHQSKRTDGAAAQRSGPLAKAHTRRRGGVAEASAYGLHRSLSDPLLGSRSADRRNAQRVGRFGPNRKGPVCRGLQHVCMGICEVALRRGRVGLHTVRVHAESLQSD